MVDLTGYKLTFDDEFNTRSISQGAGTTWSDIRSEWRFDANSDIGFGRSSFLDASSGYDPFTVKDGALTITAQPDSTPSGMPGSWESGLINTKDSFSQTYGYFEVRADLSDSFGAWDAFWMLPVKQTPPAANGSWKELDIVEHYGENNPAAYRWIHTTTGPNEQVTTSQPTQVSGYHTYGMDWQPDQISFYFDGQLVGSKATPSDMNEPMYMLYNLAVDKAPDGSSLSSKVDYVRAYSKDPGASAVALDHISSPDGVDTSNLHGAVSANAGAPVTAPPASAPANTPEPAANSAPAPAPAAAPAATEPTHAAAPATETTPAPAPNVASAAPDASHPASSTPVASGQADLKLVLSGDHFAGDPQFLVFVDGKQIGDAQSVTADHHTGEYQTFEINAGLTPGAHDIEVRFINDAWDGVHDRNLYVASIEANGETIAGSQATNMNQWSGVADEPGSAVLLSATGLHFQTSGAATPTSVVEPAPAAADAAPVQTAAAPPSPAASVVGSGDGDLHLLLSGDHFNGAPQFQLFVDHNQVGGTYSVSADHHAGEYEKFDFDAGLTAGKHDIEVRFINDAWDGVHDRNLYVASIDASGQTVHGASAANFDQWNVLSGAEASGAVLLSATGLHFEVDMTGATSVAPPADADHALLSHAMISSSTITWA